VSGFRVSFRDFSEREIDHGGFRRRQGRRLGVSLFAKFRFVRPPSRLRFPIAAVRRQQTRRRQRKIFSTRDAPLIFSPALPHTVKSLPVMIIIYRSGRPRRNNRLLLFDRIDAVPRSRFEAMFLHNALLRYQQMKRRRPIFVKSNGADCCCVMGCDKHSNRLTGHLPSLSSSA